MIIINSQAKVPDAQIFIQNTNATLRIQKLIIKSTDHYAKISTDSFKSKASSTKTCSNFIKTLLSEVKKKLIDAEILPACRT